MNDELFADLLASAEEMVAIEKGERTPDEKSVHHFDTPDVRKIREVSGKNRQEFARIIGASAETVKSWETRRRNPTGPTRKLLQLIAADPKAAMRILEQTGP
ncbi:NadS family protein [Marinobacterium weihaiense]|uniref:Transcriptional regulator n=1 Tax=Marinobacterium weihaiense TaxID=2851016 RepID=A0ABS6MF15_9GAMM|nr:NadS family protein [Marinobacterium weihaiense]MBV0934406.1 transcriptional regulator [Marinobacterium weihaiense]